ncbi:aldose-1-epimerase [Actinomyces mediterranea]|uniref:aldose-1-epimerase n=1 Tax=Actinomyces mediterranea TaxID=1871028 RepID=UPI00097030CC|nr:aldose-1-epimerase [Actinomyces mediterranea]
MAKRRASGTEIVLNSGGYEARVVTVGAALASLKLNDTDIILGHDADTIAKACQGVTLVPWPNRIADARYVFNGTEYLLDITEPRTGSAIHGFMSWVDWSVVHSDADSTTLGTFIAPRPGYPWALESWVTYALSETRGLTVTITSKNIGSESAPYGVASHPYLTLGETPNASYELTVPAASVLETDERQTPIAKRPVEELDYDYRQGRILGDQHIDHAFTDIDEGEWTVTIRDPQSDSRVNLSADAPWLQIFSAERLDRLGVAVEPMTCAPNAFNSGLGLIVLEPEESHTMTFRIHGQLA